MSTLEHFFKSTSDAGSSSSAAVPAFAFLEAQRETYIEGRVYWKEAGQLRDDFGGVEGESSHFV